MIRTQIQLTAEQADRVKALARREGASMADVVREAVDRLIEHREREDRWRRASSLIGRYHGGKGDVSAEHDKYLAEDFLG